MYAHPLGEPGFEYKETIKTGTLAAVRRVTTVCAMPNTNPVNDNSSVTDLIIRKAIQEGVHCLSDWCDNKKPEGGRTAEMGIMHRKLCGIF